ncbi:hypothetical protein P3342_004874 [Pyrenophora teres f. teres]|nr:hypothetical protein P3342_004874 [Pyrenophora teres f. teres]
MYGRGKHHGSSFGAIHEVLPVFEYLLDQLEKLAEPYADVVFDAHEEAPEDHLHINLRNAWVKAEEYYRKLDDSPVYYAATCLHPYYKYYCENSWEHKDGWLRTANARFQELWRSYKKAPPSPPPQPARTGAIDDVIEALTARRNCARRDGGDDCECERLFSELGDLLEPKLRAISSELLAALQLIRSWTRAGYTYNAKRGDDNSGDGAVSDDELARKYSIQNWVEDNQSDA